jgi:pilus assembly protein CpaE
MGNNQSDGGPVKVLIAGSLDLHVADGLAGRDDLSIVDPHANGHAEPMDPDAILYVGTQPSLLESDIQALRSWTTAPIVVATFASADSLLDAALRLEVADVLVLPQTADSLAFAMRKAARSAGPRTRGSGRLITVFSPKGGTGKTVITANLAVAFARGGLKTLLVDLDLQFGDSSMMLGVAPRATIHDLAVDSGELDAEKLAGYVDLHQSGLGVLAAPLRPEDADAIDDHTLRRLLKVARAAYDVVIVDTSPHFDSAMLTALETTDTLLLICLPEVTALKNVRMAMKTLDRLSVDLNRLSLVLNREGMPAGLSAKEVEYALEQPARFRLPNDPAVSAAVNRSVSVGELDDASSFVKAISSLARQLSEPGSLRDREASTSGRRLFSDSITARLTPRALATRESK